jgi:hypothetical protein
VASHPASLRIGEIFATTIQHRIEPVVKVVDRRPAVVQAELSNLVVTPQWERYLRGFLDTYAEAAERQDEQGIGIWISGFFGSGKSLLMKVLGTLLENDDFDGQSVHELFLHRLPAQSPDRSSIGRYLTIIKRKVTTTVVGGNLHAMQANRDDPLALIAFKLFALHRGFTQNWPLAWAIEYQIDERGKSSDFRQQAESLAGVAWDELAADPEFYLDTLYAAAAAVLPEHFRDGAASVERAVTAVLQSGITSVALIDRLQRWCAARDGGGRRHKLLLQLDELGQWIAGGPRTERAQQVQALIETAATSGQGRLWLAVTAHGDVQQLQSSLQQEEYAKINQRFTNKCKLSNEDISMVVEERLLRKTQPARLLLEDRFTERSGDLSDMGTVRGQREYPTPNAERFALFYPYMPWTVAIIPDVVKGIAQAAGRDEALTGSNRTMIGVVQGAIIETPGLLESQIGRILCLADLYDQLAADAPIETKTDLNRVRESVTAASDFTPRVARALYLLGEAEYVPTTVEHIARALANAVDADLPSIRSAAETELEKLVAAGFAKRVGETYAFLSTQQRGFQDRVRDRQEPLQFATHDLIDALKDYDSDEYLRFDRVPLEGREIQLKLELDNRVVRNSTAYVTLRVFSPFQRSYDTQIANDAAMKQRSNENPDAILIRLDDVHGLRATLALAVATDQVSQETLSSTTASDPDKEVARQARQQDLASHRSEVRRLLGQAVRGARLFFRGTHYDPLPGDSASAAIRSTLAEMLRQIYARISDVPHKIGNEDTAVRAALAGNASHPDLQALGVFRADGTLNDAHPLLSTVRARLPVSDEFQQFVQADAIRSEIERPPFGWDPNGAKVALALLMRASACRLIDNSRTLTDPQDPEVFLVLTKDLRFRNLRVQGVRSELTMAERQQIRGYIETLFRTKPALVDATLNTVIGEKLAETARQAGEVQSWANMVRCPLPQAFESGSSLVAELLNSSTPQVRLPRFREQAGALVEFHTLLHGLQEFQRDHGSEFGNVREFFTSMVNAETGLPEVSRFINDWRAVMSENSVTESRRWHEIVQSYRNARQAITNQVSAWLEEARSQLRDTEQSLTERLRAHGVPEEQVAAEVADLSTRFADVRQRLSQETSSLAEARSIMTALTNVELGLQRRLSELRAQYQPAPELPTDREWRLQLSTLAGGRRITSEAELDGVLNELRALMQARLADGQVIILE